MEDINKLLHLLIQNNVDCVLVGGYAAVVHGSATVTRDLDVCLDFRPDNIRKLLKALEKVKPCARAGSSMISLFDYTVERISQLDNLYIKTDLGKLDLLGSITGVGSYTDAKKNSVEISLFELPCHVLDIDSLIKAKQAAGRPKDQQVVLELQVIREKTKR